MIIPVQFTKSTRIRRATIISMYSTWTDIDIFDAIIMMINWHNNWIVHQFHHKKLRGKHNLFANVISDPFLRSNTVSLGFLFHEIKCHFSCCSALIRTGLRSLIALHLTISTAASCRQSFIGKYGNNSGFIITTYQIKHSLNFDIHNYITTQTYKRQMVNSRSINHKDIQPESLKYPCIIS